MVRDGRIDTLIVAITDMQGRLMGKRVQAQAFLERRDRPRRPLLHVPPRHGHGDEHARGLRPDELGDGLRRLDRRAGLGHAPRPALAREDGPRPVRHLHRGGPRRDRRLAADDPASARSPAPRSTASRSRPARSSSTTSSRSRGRSPPKLGWGIPPAFRLLQRGLPPPPGDEGRAAPSAAAQPDDRGRASRSSSARARRRRASTRSTSATTTSSNWPTGA